MCSGRRSFLPYMKWFSIFSENRLASVVRPTASATWRISIGDAPQDARGGQPVGVQAQRGQHGQVDTHQAEIAHPNGAPIALTTMFTFGHVRQSSATRVPISWIADTAARGVR